jgi:phosphoserine phosphatase
MSYKAVALDVCGVLTVHKSVWQYIHEELGLWDGVAETFQEDFLAGRITYREFCENDARLWAGRDISILEGIVARLSYREGIEGLFSTLRQLDFSVGLISTGLTLLTDRIKKDFPVDYAAANRLVEEDGVVTGGVEILIGHDGKGEALIDFAREVEVNPSEIIAVGDGASDIPMFRAAGYAIGFEDDTMENGDNSLESVDVMVPARLSDLTSIFQGFRSKRE